MIKKLLNDNYLLTTKGIANPYFTTNSLNNLFKITKLTLKSNAFNAALKKFERANVSKGFLKYRYRLCLGLSGFLSSHRYK
ncbi:hypothetical protein EC594_02850 [Helicobacter pylori]|nr:hypothetical protein ECC31_00835 [Helicobacter pylori]RVZ84400.1 hypothetical protein EC594_02850 [Helicobacter pylori]